MGCRSRRRLRLFGLLNVVLLCNRVRNSVRVVVMVFVRRVLLILRMVVLRLVLMDLRLFVNSLDGGSDDDCK